jgi:hypothetical protein
VHRFPTFTENSKLKSEAFGQHRNEISGLEGGKLVGKSSYEKKTVLVDGYNASDWLMNAVKPRQRRRLFTCTSWQRSSDGRREGGDGRWGGGDGRRGMSGR